MNRIDLLREVHGTFELSNTPKSILVAGITLSRTLFIYQDNSSDPCGGQALQQERLYLR